MALFRRSRPTLFKPVPYGGQRRSRRVPRWLLILLLGVAIGAGGLWYVQENYLPPRLSHGESIELKAQLDQTASQRDQFEQQFKRTSDELAAVRSESEKAQQSLGIARQANERLQKDLSQFVQALPPDPRGGPIGVRTATFAVASGQVTFHVVFTRQRRGEDVFRGVMQLVVTGTRAGSSREESVSLPPVQMALESYQHLSGTLAMPEGMVPREIMIRVLRAPGGEMLGMRVYRITT